MSRRAAWTFLLTLTAAAGIAGCSGGQDRVTFLTASTSTATPATAKSDTPQSDTGKSDTPKSAMPRSPVTEPSSAGSQLPTRETIATGLPVPWGLAFLPDGSALVTLRDQGEVLHIATSPSRGSTRSRPVSVGQVPGVQPGGEGGLLGIAVSPTFAADRAVFVYFTSRDDNRVQRMTLVGSTLASGPVIVKGIAKAGIHNGGRLAFGPDGYLYISTGDAGARDPAQDTSSLSGKILRVTPSGLPAPGNPFPGSPVWSLGHRNVQGMAWSKTGTMYASEFGQDTWDELNRIDPGRNYGWPVVEGIAHRRGFTDPLVQWPTDDASPSGLGIGPDGAAYLAALRGESLWRVPFNPNGTPATPQRLLQGTYGRLRTVATAPDGRVWLITGNTFRGTPRPGDDRIVALRLPVQQ